MILWVLTPCKKQPHLGLKLPCMLKIFLASLSLSQAVLLQAMEDSSQMQWAISLHGKIMLLSRSLIQQIQASPTMIWGWFDQEHLQAWSHIFPLTLESQNLGYLLLLPLVEIPNGHPNNGRRENIGVESTIANFTGTSFAQIKHFRGGPNKGNHGGRSSNNKFNGGLWKQ